MLAEKGTGDVENITGYYYFYIFYKNQCIYSINLSVNDKTSTDINNKNEGKKNEIEKLLLGSIYAINYLCFNIQPNRKIKNLYKSIESTNKNIKINTNTNIKIHNQNILNTQSNLHVGNFNTFNTPLYKLHYFESLTAYKFVIITDKNVPSLSAFLKDIYKTIFLDLVVLNPLYNVGDEIKDKAFDEKILKLIEALAVV
ncbi:trafficking protein particle complex subunit 1, putative [Hepatocystis sp. ex Piliocolobus tephrosceles]|nr:trafficking protein particle complex subunit 1, putative [Hepatocystis sp. ex Piliocolobus tephrosceles]